MTTLSVCIREEHDPNELTITLVKSDPNGGLMSDFWYNFGLRCKKYLLSTPHYEDRNPYNKKIFKVKPFSMLFTHCEDIIASMGENISDATFINSDGISIKLK